MELGVDPLFPENNSSSCRGQTTPWDGGDSAKTVPQLQAEPPLMVVPQRLPNASKATPPSDPEPWALEGVNDLLGPWLRRIGAGD